MKTTASDSLNIVIIGLTITSSWGNGHATTYRGLMRELAARGHNVLFLEHDKPWYASHRDMPNPPYGMTALYSDIRELKTRFESDVRRADLTIVGSYVPQGVEVGDWVIAVSGGIKAFYDIDTPVTLAKLERGEEEYISRAQVARYDMYLSFTGGPTLDRLMGCFGSPLALPLYCSFDPELYYPEEAQPSWDLGYLGTYSPDRQPVLNEMMLRPALDWNEGRFVVAGPQYPADVQWPGNVHRIDHLPPMEHRSFYNSQRYTLNVTRADMAEAGYSPSVRLFEAAACGTPIISDHWEGLDAFFEPDVEILVSRSSAETLEYLRDLPEGERRSIGDCARKRVLESHTAAHRAAELEAYVTQVLREESRRPVAA